MKEMEWMPHQQEGRVVVSMWGLACGDAAHAAMNQHGI